MRRSKRRNASESSAGSASPTKDTKLVKLDEIASVVTEQALEQDVQQP